MIKVSDYIAKFVAAQGVKHVFMVTGGGAMHLNDSFGAHPDIEVICNHHEQACAIAAEGYARLNGKLAVVNVTTGPGGLNTLTGVLGQWTDSMPVLYISGQVKHTTTVDSCREIPLRQLGDQEVDIIEVVKPLTKFAESVTDPLQIRRVLSQAVVTAMKGRRGPVWVDVPMDVQGAQVEESELVGFTEDSTVDRVVSDAELTDVVAHLTSAKRPVIVAGHGIRLAKAEKVFFLLTDKLGIPVLSTFNGYDLIATNHPLYVGRIGTLGTRAGNFALQNADVVLCLGTRNNIRQASYNWENFAHRAYKIVVDIDPSELEKPTVHPDLAICADAGSFVQSLMHALDAAQIPDRSAWLAWCKERQAKYPVVLGAYKTQIVSINPYYFVDVLTKAMGPEAVAIAGNGTACVALFQAGNVKTGQRQFWNSGCASMGYDLPAAIGACIGSGKKDVICLAGDGSLQMNIQELATVAHLGLPIKLFYLNNDGYASIKQTQDNFFHRRIGCCPQSGVGFPDILKVAAAYGIPSESLHDNQELEQKIASVLAHQGPIICEVKLSTDYTFMPKLSSEKLPDGKMVSKPLEDLYPFLPREEFESNMIRDE